MKLLLTGTTGFVGGEVLSQSLRNPAISSIVVLTRRPLSASVANESKVKQVIMKDFKVYPDEVKKELESADACVWTMGTRLCSPEVEVDYPLAFARAVVSARSASATKPFRYIYCSGRFAERDQTKSLWVTPEPRRIKGRAESSMLEFAKSQGPAVWETYIAKPGIILLPAGDVLKHMVAAFTIGTVRVHELAATMLQVVTEGGDRDTYEIADINRLIAAAMILDAKPTTVDDAPPDYQSAVASSSAPRPQESKFTTPGLPSSPISKSPSAGGAAASRWFSLAFPSPTTRHVRATVLGLVKDLVKLPPADHTVVAVNILRSCAEACAANSLSMSSLLQERSVEGHTPLYWAVIKRPTELTIVNGDGTTFDLLSALLALSAPLTPATISDIRVACIINSDQALFQRLRNTPDFAPLSATDALLLDAAAPPDDILVEEDVSGSDAAAAPFAVDFTIMQFQKRMRIGGAVQLEFIARGRLWQLRFGVSKEDFGSDGMPCKGTWYVSLSLLEQSTPTWVDARLLVPAAVDQREEEGKEATEGSSYVSTGSGKGKQRPLPTLSLRVKGHLNGNNAGFGSRINVALDKADGGLGVIQYTGSPYISVDESFTARLEARLVKPEGECIIC
ncbi:hypothetical protein MKEN_01086400 [Mycena kentingensis (nom. inval.)]|nr:hypothetical protein MKEN_01086400 [Mycena kentingensis (nom. inval.)]